MWRNEVIGRNKGLVWANATATLSAAGSASLTPSLPAGATGIPRKIKAAGNVSAIVTLAIGNTQEIVVLVNPNAPPSEEEIPAKAFDGPVNSVAVTVTTSGAGNVYVAIGFEP